MLIWRRFQVWIIWSATQKAFFTRHKELSDKIQEDKTFKKQDDNVTPISANK